STNFAKIGNEEPFGPTINPARIAVTGVPYARKMFSTSNLLFKCRDNCSSLSGIILLKYIISFILWRLAARATLSANITSISSNDDLDNFAERTIERTR